jgi:hypothetical protein
MNYYFSIFGAEIPLLWKDLLAEASELNFSGGKNGRYILEILFTVE